MSTKAKRLLAMLLGALFTMALVSVIIMALWNYLLVDLTGFKPVSIWQALGLGVLGRSLASNHKWMAP